MQHASCVRAISELRQTSAARSNVTTESSACECKLEPSKCDWVGNGTRYACLPTPSAVAQRVYDGMNSTKAATITSPTP